MHHITPIETATTMEEMKRLAFCGLDGLMSLCDDCHHKVHEEMKSFSRESVKARADARLARWIDNVKGIASSRGDERGDINTL